MGDGKDAGTVTDSDRFKYVPIITRLTTPSPWRRSVCCLAVLSSIVVLFLHSRGLMSNYEEHHALWALWGGAAEVILDVDGVDLWMQPAEADFPELLREHAAFALTAFDPPGLQRRLTENT